MTYDDASWHCRTDAFYRLPDAFAATHIGMYLAWAILRGLGGQPHDLWAQDTASLKTRVLTPGAWLIHYCDGKLADAMLNAEGNAFTAFYYEGEGGDDDRAPVFAPDYAPNLAPGLASDFARADAPDYAHDYALLLAGDLDTLYEAPDTWETFDKLAPVLDARLTLWRGARA